jgi:S-adenosylmethionine-diacylglycerol 3-amino-3-carboxypropyl transferase
MKKITETVAFDIIRYANVWEDAEILLKALQMPENSRILSIGSAGDNCFALLTTNPQIVVAVDVNIVQLHLIELKRAAIRGLKDEEVWQFLGFRPSTDRWQTFLKIQQFLPNEVANYWQTQRLLIEKGIITQGKFERYFRLFAKKILPLIHSKKTIEELLRPKSAEEQQDFYTQKWNTWRWRLLFKVFFGKYVMGKLGRDPEFLKQVHIPVHQFIFNRAENHIKSTLSQHSFMFRYNLTGYFGDLLPPYLQPENLAVIRKNLDKLVLKQGFAEDAINDFGQFDAMNLSDIFEYMDSELFKETAKKLASGLKLHGKVAYWNLMVPRQLSKILPKLFSYKKDISESLAKEDKGFYYRSFFIEEKINI